MRLIAEILNIACWVYYKSIQRRICIVKNGHGTRYWWC